MNETDKAHAATEARKQGDQAMTTDTRDERQLLRSIEAKLTAPPGVQNVYVVNANMPFGAMVGLVIKFWFATLVAFIVLVVLAVLVSALTGGALMAGLSLLTR